jgi:cell division inhibitor SepF
MGALRKAGVWLGLVEEEDERGDDGGYDDEYAEDDEEFAPSSRPRSLTRPARSLAEREGRRSEGRSAADLRSSDLRSSEPRSSNLRTSDARLDPRSSEPRDPRPPEPRVSPAELRAAAARRIEARGADRDLLGSDIHDGEPDSGERRGSDRSGFVQPRSAEYESPRSERSSERGTERTTERATVRQLGRPSSTSATKYSTQDNLALTPQVHLRERGVVGDDTSRRYQITTLHPTTYSEARTIGEHFRDGYPVIMNLTEMDEADAKRLVDFAAGLAFGLRGSFERVTNRVFLLSPANIQVTAEDKARIAEGGFFSRS